MPGNASSDSPASPGEGGLVSKAGERVREDVLQVALGYILPPDLRPKVLLSR